MCRTWFLSILVSLISVVSAAVDRAEADLDTGTTKTIDDNFKNYDKRVRPFHREKPLDVLTSIYVLDVFNIDETKHEFTVNMYFRHHWEDERLKFTGSKNMDRILLGAEHAKKVWIPDTFMPNERKSTTHAVGALQEMIRISPNGKVLRSTRITITASCIMSLGYFPFDNQLCSLEIESYLVYSWKEGKQSVGVSSSIGSLKYRVTGFNTNKVVVTLEGVNYTRLGLEFFMVRNAARFLQDAYFPAIVLTLLAFSTLFMASLTQRIQISFLLMGFKILFISLNSIWMPRVSYQTALDLYIFICANFVLNVAVVNFILHMYHKPSSRRQFGCVGQSGLNSAGMRRLDECSNGGIDDMKENLCDTEDGSKPNLNTKVDEIVYNIAKRSKYTLPIAFLAINLLYWMVVLIGSSGFPEDFILVENRG